MIITFLWICLSLFLFATLISFLHRVWWTPIYIQHATRPQGIKGPPYKFLFGNTKEASDMKRKSTTYPMDLSHNMFRRINPDIYSWMKLYGKHFLVWHGPQARFVVTEPELVKEVMSNKEDTYPKMKFNGYIKKLLGDGLVVTEEAEKWMKLRKLANHAFYAESLKDMVPAMIASVESMLQRWSNQEGKKEIEAYKEFKVLTSEIISRTGFGSSYLEGKRIFELLTKLGELSARNESSIRIPGIHRLYKSSDEIESEIVEQSLRESIIAVIKKREEGVNRGGEEAKGFGNDFLGLLLKAHHETDKRRHISIDNVVDECKVFYLAGHETTTGLMSWLVFFLALHADWQEKARKEVLEIFGQENPSPEGIAKLKTANMIINETLRLYPPVTALGRRTKREVRLGKFILPANVEIFIPVLALHNNPEIWGQDSHLFKPERFSEGMAKATKNYNTAAFLPFGYGPRTCVGVNFAINEVKIVLSMILQRYRFSLSSDYVHSPGQILTIRPMHGLQVVLQSL